MTVSSSRRRFIRLLTAAGLGSLAGCGDTATSGTSERPTTDTVTTTDKKVPKSIYEFLVEDYRGPDNYDGLEDYTGEKEVEILVGAEGNGGHYAFDPPAIHIDDGTTVTWRWTGKGGGHQVQGTHDSFFESSLTAEKGHTFTREFKLEPPNDHTGLYSYRCSEHDTSKGERAAIVVGTCCGRWPDPNETVPSN